MGVRVKIIFQKKKIEFCLLFDVSFDKMSDLQLNGTTIPKLRVVDLKNELDARGLSKSGKKDELVARLVSFIEHEMKTAEREAEEKSAETEEEILKTEDASSDSNENQGSEEANLKSEKEKEKALVEESAKKAKEEEAKAENERKEAEK